MTDIDDKIIQRASERGTNESDMLNSVGQVAEEYEEAFMSDMRALNVLHPDSVLRVTEHIDDISTYIQKIMENGMAYETEDGIYFDTQAFGEERYGKLGMKASESSHSVDGLGDASSSSSSSSSSNKRHWRDFALWKNAKAGEPAWPSHVCRHGRPGWHIECSAMTFSAFGETLDFHSGGVDLKFPHHTNEIAQSEAHNAREGWVKFWLHTGHLYIKGSKMSKSLKNFISIRDYLDTTQSPLPAADLRIFFLQHKYHSSLHFSQDRIAQAGVFRTRIQAFLSQVHPLSARAYVRLPARPCATSEALLKKLSETKKGIHRAFLDDFDTPHALNLLSDLVACASGYLGQQRGDEALAFEPLMAVAEYVTDLLTIMGLESITSVTHAGINKSESSSHAGRGAEVAIAGMVEYRTKVRAASLAGKRAVKKLRRIQSHDDDDDDDDNNSSSSSSSSSSTSTRLLDEVDVALLDIMAANDWARDTLCGDRLGVVLVDDPWAPGVEGKEKTGKAK